MQSRYAALGHVSFCAGLPREAIAELARIAVPLRRQAGAMIQLEGDAAEAMYVVAAGRVKIARHGAGGREQVLHVIERGGHFNAVPMFDGGPCPASAEALTDVELLAMPRAALRPAVEAHPALALALLGEFAGRLRHLVNLVDDLALHTVHGRLAGLLLAQAEAAQRGAAASPLTQAEMAAQIGTVREMVGRALKAFESMGLIALDRGSIAILDRAGLERQRET